jgi:long-subunit fatty acid transport protein
MPVLQADGRGRGMGGVSIASRGENFSALNPALMSQFHRSAISGMIIPGYSFPRDRTSSSTNRSYEFSYLKFVFPLPAKFVFSAGLHQVLDFDWEVNRPFTFQGETLTETFRTAGAIFKGQLAVARPIFRGLRGGLGIDFYRGEISDVREMIFQGTFYPFGTAIDVLDEYTYETSAFGTTVGLLYTPHDAIQTGFYYKPSYDLEMDERFETNSGTLSQRALTASMPSSWGIGLSFKLTRGFLLAFDHNRTDWSTFSINDDDAGFRKGIDYVIGAEFTTARRRDDSWLKKSTIRGGYRVRELPMKVGGVGVDERVVTAGWGVPIGSGIGRFDLAMEMGSRGDIEDNGMRERLVRFGLSLSAFEKWVPFERRRRR